MKLVQFFMKTNKYIFIKLDVHVYYEILIMLIYHGIVIMLKMILMTLLMTSSGTKIYQNFQSPLLFQPEC